MNAEAMNLCRAHYITPEQTIMGLEVRSWALHCQSCFGAKHEITRKLYRTL